MSTTSLPKITDRQRTVLAAIAGAEEPRYSHEPLDVYLDGKYPDVRGLGQAARQLVEKGLLEVGSDVLFASGPREYALTVTDQGREVLEATRVKVIREDYERKVFLDGEQIGKVTDRVESYSGIRSANGRSGGTYTFYEAHGMDGRRVTNSAFRHTTCGTQVVHKTDDAHGGFRKLWCESCEVFPGETVKQIGGVVFTTENGRDARLGADRVRDAVAALVAAYKRENTTPGGKVLLPSDYEALADDAEKGHPDA